MNKSSGSSGNFCLATKIGLEFSSAVRKNIEFRYDALLGSGHDWKTLCERGMLHGGDNDSTGAISAAWFGALYGFKGVPENHFKVN